MQTMERSLVSIFNEKALCGLGREVQSTGLLAPDAVLKALTSLRRFRALCRVMKVGRVHAIATAACRDATNGPDFIAKAERICGVRIDILSGPLEAKLSALGVISGVHRPDGIVGDLGGGSLELIDVRGNRVRQGVTLPLGSLALQDTSHKSLKRAERIVKTDISGDCAAQGRPRPDVLRGRRNVARAGAHSHHPERLSAPRDARLFHSGRGRAGFRAPPAPPGGRQHAGQHRSVSRKPGGRCSPMRRWFSNTSFALQNRRPSCFRPMACAKACCIRCCRKRSAPRTD